MTNAQKFDFVFKSSKVEDFLLQILYFGKKIFQQAKIQQTGNYPHDTTA